MSHRGPRWGPPHKRHDDRLPTYMPLDYLKLEDVRRWRANQDALADFHWRMYNELSKQRANIIERFHDALREGSKVFPISGYVRVVSYKWSEDPLSAAGSLNVPGGRFNIGDIID